MEDRRIEALREWLPMLLDLIHRAGEGGLSVRRASRDSAAVPGFVQALRNQRANLLQFAQLWPDQIRIEKRGTQNIMGRRASLRHRRRLRLHPHRARESPKKAAKSATPGWMRS